MVVVELEELASVEMTGVGVGEVAADVGATVVVVLEGAADVDTSGAVLLDETWTGDALLLAMVAGVLDDMIGDSLELKGIAELEVTSGAALLEDTGVADVASGAAEVVLWAVVVVVDDGAEVALASVEEETGGAVVVVVVVVVIGAIVVVASATSFESSLTPSRVSNLSASSFFTCPPF